MIFAFDTYKNNITDELITSKFVRNHIEYNLRSSTLNLLVESRVYSEYLANQPIIRMIRLINNYKTIVTECESIFKFKRNITEEIEKQLTLTRRYRYK